MTCVFYRFACIWVWSLFLLSLLTIGVIYYFYYLYWLYVATLFNDKPEYSNFHTHYILSSVGMPFTSSICEYRNIISFGKTKTFLFQVLAFSKCFLNVCSRSSRISTRFSNWLLLVWLVLGFSPCCSIMKLTKLSMTLGVCMLALDGPPLYYSPLSRSFHPSYSYHHSVVKSSRRAWSEFILCSASAHFSLQLLLWWRVTLPTMTTWFRKHFISIHL